ncbi:MAG: 4-alpha-glucanotransferase [Bacilli bacterium]|nr:4-alpha-glucanotransferase [Bacilli bacterium]
MKDNVGVLLPISSLPGRHGIGDFGPSSYKFVRWLKKNHYAYWQVLPINPLGPGNSPYMSTCSEAIENRYIDLDELKKLGLVKHIPSFQPHSKKIQYEAVRLFKEKILYKAFLKFIKKPMRGYQKFKKDHPWLEKYALFITFRKKMNFIQWNRWPKWMQNYFDEHSYLPSEDVMACEFEMFMQFVAYRQYYRLWKYARKMGIKIIADCPFYVGIDSTDCWLNKDEFLLDENNHPTLVSGCPPDAFSDDGQLWGTPIYNFEKMKQNNYSFLVNRIGYLASTCDMLRLDHFRAFDTYCVIPAEDFNARRGKWEVGPREEFFDALYAKYPNINLIAEDLGDLFPSVLELRDKYNLPGMYICEFTIFDENAMSTNRQIVYPGTHDNQTLFGWFKSLSKENKVFLQNKFKEKNDKRLFAKIFSYIYSLPSFMTIFMLQDLLKMDDRGRINWPGTVGDPNWTFKFVDFEWVHKIVFPQEMQ